jgi:hypothetical protein
MAGSPKFLGQKDHDFFKSLTAEVSDLFFREVEIRVIDRDSTVVDPLYTESKNIKYKKFSVRAQLDIRPKQTTLKKFGLDEDRQLIVTIESSVLTRGDESYPDGFPVPSEGDLMIVEGEAYEVMDEQRVDYWWHTESAFTHLFSLVRLRDRSIADQKPVDPANPAGPVEVPTYAGKHNPYPGEEE